MKRRLAVLATVLAAALAVYVFLVRDTALAPTLGPLAPTAVIGSGEQAVGVGPEGRIMRGWPPPEPGSVPSLPIDSAPDRPRLRGRVLEQARVLGAAPAALRPHIERSYIGPTGVEVVLRSGIEVRFGTAADAGRKWRAAAAVLADPGTEALSYVNVISPSHPATGGSDYLLPALP